MNSLQLNEEDLDDDIFVIKQVKPINKLTFQDALLLKHNVLKSFKVKNDTNSTKKNKTNKKSDTKIRFNETVKGKGKKIKNNTPESNPCLPPKNSISPKSIFKNSSVLSPKSDSVSPQSNKSPTNFLNAGEITPKKNSSFSEDVQISPGIAYKRKRFSIPDYFSPEKSPSKETETKRKLNNFYKGNTKFNKRINFNSLKKNEEIFNIEDLSWSPFEKMPEEEEKSKDETMNNKEIKNNATGMDEITFTDNATLLCFLLKKIITQVTRQQLELEGNKKNEKMTEKLLLENECDILENFFKLDDILCKLYVRLLCRRNRKNDWHRVSGLAFKDININLYDAFLKLHEKNFVDINIEDEDLEFQLNFLKRNEINELCKLLNINCKTATKKPEQIQLIVKTCKSQKSVSQFLNNSKNNSLSCLIQKEVTKNLGLCIKLNETAKSTFSKIIVLFSFSHYFGEEEFRLRDQLYLYMNVHKGFTKFVNYKVNVTVVFPKHVDFVEYCKALTVRESFELAIISKKYNEFLSIAEFVELEFIRLLNDEKYCERFKSLEPFLKKFSAGYIYGKILTKFCEIFKKQTDNNKIIKITQLLLNQKIFLSSKRGKWYEILSQTFENLKETKSAAEVLIEGLEDSSINEIQKLTLQFRAQAILKKRTNGITEAYLKNMLEQISVITVQNPPSIEIRGRSLQENKSGFKCVYVEETNKGKMFTSVEELALSYYKTTGFKKGHHTEGYIIHCLYALIFFDIIYGPSSLGVFQSAFQESPLDFYSKSFYVNRKNLIDVRLKEMCDWTDEEVEKLIKKTYYDNCNTSCIIAWKENYTPELFCEVLKCISLPLFAQICRRLVENASLTGFPDLTLWNPETLKCKFVEVKSPNDKLSCAQRVWLDFLKKVGIECEVCNIKNTGRKFSL